MGRVHAQERGAVDRAWQEALKGAAFDHEHRIMLGEAVRWIRQKADLEFAADGTALRAVGIAQDITERKAAEEHINTLAYYDPLTGLPNRRLLRDCMKQGLASCSRSGRGGAHRSTASIGIAPFGRDPTTANDLLKQADIAMYQAKAAGRNALSFFEPPLSTSGGNDGVQDELFKSTAGE